jgi:tigrfam_recA: protein RecA
LPRFRREAESQDSSMRSMPLIRFTPRISVWILIIFTFHSRITESRLWRLQRPWCALVLWISWSWTLLQHWFPRQRSKAIWETAMWACRHVWCHRHSVNWLLLSASPTVW